MKVGSVSGGGNSSVVGDSLISFIWCRRHLIAAIQLAVSRSELYFARPETDWNIRIGKQGYVSIYFN